MLPYRFMDKGYGSHQAMADLIPDQCSVLDVGCASGYFMKYLETNKNCRCVGIEVVKEYAEHGCEEGLDIIIGDAAEVMTHLAKTRKFDCIVLGDVLEHVINPFELLSTAVGTLNEAGCIVISIPNIVSMRARLNLLMGKWEYRDSGIFDRTHLRFFSIKSARKMIQDAGLIVLEERFVGPLTFIFGSAMLKVNAMRPGFLANQMVVICSR